MEHIVKHIGLAIVLSLFAVQLLAATDGYLLGQPETPKDLPSAPPPTKKEYDPRLHFQLSGFLPYASMSMDNELIAGHPLAEVLGKILRAKEFDDNPLDAHPLLQSRSRELVSFLAGSRNRIEPAYKEVAPSMPAIVIETNDPMMMFGLALFSYYETAMKNAVIRSWQEEYDRTCRTVYKDLLPIARDLSKGEETKLSVIAIKPNFDQQKWIGLTAVNSSDQDLGNVSLAIKFGTIDGQTSDHYYYLKSWKKGQVLPLRLDTLWNSRVGAMCTTTAQIELVSDELLARRIDSHIDDHIPSAATRILDELSPQIASNKKLAEAIGRLSMMEKSLAAHPELASTRAELEKVSRLKLKEILAGIDEAIKNVDAEYAKVEGQYPDVKWSKDRFNEFNKKKAADKDLLKSKRQKLKQERADYTSGKK